MSQDRSTFVATVTVFVVGAIWGFYWLPVRTLENAGLPGAWGTVAITFAALTVLAPLVIARWRRLAKSNPVALISILLGGAAFALYSVGFVYGRVAIVILLFYLTPVWSALIARYVMGWQTTRLRFLAIGLGLVGLAVMLGAEGKVPLPRGVGEWMALAAGVLWSIGTTGMRVTSDLPPVAAAFVFVLGALVMALSIAPFLEPWPGVGTAAIGRAVALAFGTGVMWWALSVVALLWATVRLEPARVGILLMAEVLIGAVTASIIAGEHLSALEIAGGVLVLCAGVMEVWPARRVTPKPPG